jgi:hypothetical protein
MKTEEGDTSTGRINRGRGTTSEDGILKDGFMFKKSHGVLKYWKEKYFILCQGTLFVYQSDHVSRSFKRILIQTQDQTPRNIIYTQGITFTECNGIPSNSSPFNFEYR